MARSDSRRLLRTRLRAVQAELAAAQALDVEAIHRMRVALRRLRGALRALGKTRGLAKDEREARRLLRALGEVRDLQVHGAPVPRAMARALGRALARWAQRAPRVAAHVADHAVHRLDGQHLRRHLRARGAACAAAMQAAALSPDPKTLHRARIALKKVRYALELLQPAQAKRLAPLQAALGHFLDAPDQSDLRGPALAAVERYLQYVA